MTDFFASPDVVKARAAHRCSTCFRRIGPGERYRRQNGMYDGCWYTFRQCAHCVAVWDLYRPEDAYGQISEGGYDDWQCDAPRTVTEARHIAQFRRGWRRLDGGLYPVPVRFGVTA